ncbi:energy transducer TonB [Azonexus sp.]|uniref:energy transducer TonB n=1 Tax=Azonexus sp. TaxID=1872668 RepID=UPI0039E486CD
MLRPISLPAAAPGSRLGFALAASLLAHALILATPHPTPPSARTVPPPLQASWRAAPPPPAAPPTAPELQLPPEAAAHPAPPPTAPKAPAARAKTWTQSVREQFAKQQHSGQFYPVEAITQGLEGEALVYFILDPAGNVSAARIEESSGHALLDTAAVHAVRRLRGLPADAPQEALLPVRFRLR